VLFLKTNGFTTGAVLDVDGGQRWWPSKDATDPMENFSTWPDPSDLAAQHCRRPTEVHLPRNRSTFNALFLETLNKRDHVALLGLRHLKFRQSRSGMAEKHIPVTIADAHPSVSDRHVPTAIVHWAACAGAEKVDEELLFAHDSVLSAMRPEAPKLWIGPEPG
jgi:hypothetical protein